MACACARVCVCLCVCVCVCVCVCEGPFAVAVCSLTLHMLTKNQFSVGDRIESSLKASLRGGEGA